jgi:hypothetical protein
MDHHIFKHFIHFYPSFSGYPMNFSQGKNSRRILKRMRFFRIRGKWLLPTKPPMLLGAESA